MSKFLKSAVVSGFAVLGGCYNQGSCVARGTPVRTPKGSRPIDELAVGDELYSVDPESGLPVATRITFIRSAKRECVRLNFDGGALLATSDHPVYCPRSRSYAPAGDWVTGNRTTLLLCAEGEGLAPAERTREVTVTGASSFAGLHEVFDLTVEHALHNFIAAGVLVHNKSPLQEQCRASDGGVFRAPDGGQLFEGDFCECPDGKESYVDCGSIRADRCYACTFPTDAGAEDGGTGDAGNSDAGDGGS